MDQKVILTNLARVKSHYNKGNSLEALNSIVSGLDDIVKIPSSKLSTNIKSALREASQLVARDKVITEGLTAPIIYKAGEEKNLHILLVTIQNRLVNGPEESREEAKARKLKMDKAYMLGVRLLQANKISEADQVFHEAIKLYKDEFRLFTMIINALIGAGQNVRATGYIKKALEIYPESPELFELQARIKGQ